MNKLPLLLLFVFLTLETIAQKQFDNIYFESFLSYKSVVEAFYTENNFEQTDKND